LSDAWSSLTRGVLPVPSSLRCQVSHKVDDRNTVEPSISLKSGHMTYGWTRALNGGGSVQAVYNPGETVDVTWKDNGANGVWNTKVRLDRG